eukprot:SM000023S07713  [mRNA]  locus=s23:902842:907230:- [translate_table: standard]
MAAEEPPPPPPVSAEAAAPAAPAVRIYAPRGGVLPAFWRDKHEHDAARNWDLFYRRNAANFFKDRHYLHHEWGQYLLAAEVGGDSTAPGLVILEACPTKPQDHKQKPLLMLSSRQLELGCGAGNTVYPLLAANKEAFVYATDFSPRAVELVKAHAEYSASRIKAFVSDISVDDLVENVPAASVDIAMMAFFLGDVPWQIFVLSAISPTKMHAVLCNIAKVLKPGGRVLLRDYAAGDLAQERLMAKEQKISDSFFARGDGTLVYYFTEAYLKDLFSTAAFQCEHMKIHSREIANRARQLVMSRRWIQGTFALRANSSAQSALLFAASGSDLLTVKVKQEQSQVQPSRLLEELFVAETDGVLALKEIVQGDNLSSSSSDPTYAQDVCISKGEKPSNLRQRFQHSAGGGGEYLEDLPILGDIYAEQLEYVTQEVKVGRHVLVIKALSQEYQHVQDSTGLLIWDSSKALAELLAARPQLCTDKAVLELGCGAAALPSLVAAAEGARVIVATDGDPSILVLLEENIRASKMRQKVQIEQLQWGDAEDVLQTKELNGGEPFDLVLGSDVVYIKEAMPLMFETARALLPQPQDNRNAVSESEILEAARAYGFQLLKEDPSSTLHVDGDGAADSVTSLSSLLETWQCGPLRILPFMRRTQTADHGNILLDCCTGVATVNAVWCVLHPMITSIVECAKAGIPEILQEDAQLGTSSSSSGVWVLTW